MKREKSEYYKSRFLATVRFVGPDKFVVEGGKNEKLALENAKFETSFCYVKDLATNLGVKLNLIQGAWLREA
jgi:hypothetical protein